MMWMLDRWERIACGLLDINPPGVRRFMSREPNPKQLRREERRRRKYAISPNQPYVEGDEEEGEDEDGDGDVDGESSFCLVLVLVLSLLSLLSLLLLPLGI